MQRRVSRYERKRIGGESYGACAVRDELTDVLEKSKQADCLIFGGPIFSSAASGMTRRYWERLFSPVRLRQGVRFPGEQKIHTAFVYTMTSTREECEKLNYYEHLLSQRQLCHLVFGPEPRARLNSVALEL